MYVSIQQSKQDTGNGKDTIWHVGYPVRGDEFVKYQQYTQHCAQGLVHNLGRRHESFISMVFNFLIISKSLIIVLVIWN